MSPSSNNVKNWMLTRRDSAQSGPIGNEMNIQVYSCGLLAHRNRIYRCALGKEGLTANKREGDGATPIGRFCVRELLYRCDRVAIPTTGLASRIIQSDSGWSDDPSDPVYNREVHRPHRYGHESLFREDNLYDLIVPLGYNDSPPVAGLGSAIFLHVARDNYAPTEGCVALAMADLLCVLRDLKRGDAVVINPPVVGLHSPARRK
jgi:L,D-peptidoglycan transpeptidase YkuD (ErfK/YbiS/YcfS/YnhG family)